MPRLSLPLLCFGIILVQLDEGRFITKARPKKYDCSEIEKYSRENALQTSGKSVEGEVANWWKGQMPLCSRTQWSFESLADQNSEFLCWRFQFCAQLTPSNEKYWQKGTRKFYSQAIWPSFSRPSTQEGRGTWLSSVYSGLVFYPPVSYAVMCSVICVPTWSQDTWHKSMSTQATTWQQESPALT